MSVTRDDLLRATTLKALGHVALKLGLSQALGRPMWSIVGGPRGRVAKELSKLARQAGGEDLATLLAYGDDLLSTKAKKPLKAKLLQHARSFLVDSFEKNDASPVERPRTRAALRAWAQEHHVAPLLNVSIYHALNPTDPTLFAGMVDREVENGPFELLLGDPDLDQRTRIAKPRLDRLRAAAWAYMQAKAAEAAEALAEQAQSGITVPPADDDDSVKARLIRRALDARQAIVHSVLLRPASRIRAEPVSMQDGTPPVFVFTEAPEDRFAFPTRVRIALSLTEPWQPQCSAHKNPCPHHLAALDALLDLLKNGDPDQVAAIVDPVGLPGWARGLKALDAVLATDDEEEPAATDSLISWGISLAGRRPELGPWLQVPTKAGGFGKPRRIKPDKLLDGAYNLDPDDRHVTELLELYQLMPDPRSPRAARVLHRALTRLVGHPRVIRQPEGTPLAVRAGTLSLVTVRSEGQVRLLPCIDEDVLPLDVFRERLKSRVGRLLLHDNDESLVLIEVSTTFETVVDALAQHNFSLPERALPELVQRLPTFARRISVVLDREVPRIAEPAQRHLVLRLTPRGRGLTVVAAVQPLPDGPTYPPGEGPAEVLSVGPERELRAALRDRQAEAAWVRHRLAALLVGAQPDEQPWRFALADPQDALTTLDGLRTADDVSVLWPGGTPWRITQTSAHGRTLRIAVRDRPDWFGLSGDVEVDGHRVPLDGLVDAVRREQTFVAVGPGHWARIGDELRAKLDALEPHVRIERQGPNDELAVTPAAAEALEALGSDGEDFVRSVRWQANLQKLEAARQAEDTPPTTLQAELRDYQLEGFRWMIRLATWGLGACLADDMGLGKTLQALAVISARATEGPQLVVAPTSVVYNWVREAEKFTPDLRPVLYLGPDRAALLDDVGPGALLITTYGLVVRDAELLASRTFASLVLDEAQAIKNAHSQRSAAVRGLAADWRLALSGTPVENHLGELWALFAAIAPGLLGGWTDFRDRFVIPIERDGHQARAEALSRLIRPFVLRRTKQEVATELPPRTSIDLDVVLTEAEQAAYEQARTEAVAQLAGAEGPSQGRFEALAALTRLRQLACHPKLVDANSDLPSSKLARLMELVRNLADTDQRALVFSQFTRHLALVIEALDAGGHSYLYIDGQTPPEVRAERVDRFQQGEGRLFLISLKAGGTGLNLTGADTVVHLDPWWNPAVEDQATDRAYRIGQTKPVTVYRLIAKDTIEEGIVKLHADKRALVAQVLDGTQTAGGLSTDELIGLIRGGGR